MKTITIRLDDRLDSQLEKTISMTGSTKSQIVREALIKHLNVKRFRQLRNKLLPFAEAQGILTDEDVFKEIS